MANNKLKYPTLSIFFLILDYISNQLLEKYVGKNLIEETFPGLKPESNWPVSLDDLLDKLTTVKLEEFFHQPFDLKGEFEGNAKIFIRNKFCLLKESRMDSHLEYAVKSLQAFLSLNILQGSHSKMAECLDFLRDLKNE